MIREPTLQEIQEIMFLPRCPHNVLLCYPCSIADIPTWVLSTYSKDVDEDVWTFLINDEKLIGAYLYKEHMIIIEPWGYKDDKGTNIVDTWLRTLIGNTNVDSITL